MKTLKTILVAIVGLLFITGCSKEETIKQQDPQSSNIMYTLEPQAEDALFKAIKVDQFLGNPTPVTITPTFGYTAGLYQPNHRDPIMLTWLGDTNNATGYGTAELYISNPAYTMHLLMESECITAQDNKVMYGAIVTEVLELSGNAPSITEMWRLYFQVEDNSHVRSREDKISNKWIFASPRSQSLCNIYPPNHSIWSSNGTNDVVAPGYVQVTD